MQISPNSAVAPHAASLKLRPALGVIDLVLLNVATIIGLRWISTAAQIGPSGLSLWLILGSAAWRACRSSWAWATTCQNDWVRFIQNTARPLSRYWRKPCWRRWYC